MTENKLKGESLLKYFDGEQKKFIIGLTRIKKIRDSILYYIIHSREFHYQVEMEDESKPKEQKNKLLGEMFYEYAFSRLQLSYKTDSITNVFYWYKNIDPNVTQDSEEIVDIYAFCKYYFDR